MAISMLKIRRPLGRLIFNMGIAIPGKTVFLIETAPCLSNTINTVAADGLVMLGARTSGAMVLTLCSQNITVSDLEGLKWHDRKDTSGLFS